MGFKKSLDIYRPKVLYGDQVITVFPPLPIYLLVIAYLPLSILFVGGALGGLIGGVGTAINFLILERKMSSPLKIMANVAVFLLSIALYLFLAIIIGSLIKK